MAPGYFGRWLGSTASGTYSAQHPDLIASFDPVGDDVVVPLKMAPPVVLQLLFSKILDGVLRSHLEALSDGTVVGEQVVSLGSAGFTEPAVQDIAVLGTANKLKRNLRHLDSVCLHLEKAPLSFILRASGAAVNFVRFLFPAR